MGLLFALVCVPLEEGGMETPDCQMPSQESEQV